MVLLQTDGNIPYTEIKVKMLEIRHKPDGSSVASMEPRTYEGEQIFGTLKMPIPLPLDQLQDGEADDLIAKKEILYVKVTIQYYDGFAMAENGSLFQFDGPASDNWTTV